MRTRQKVALGYGGLLVLGALLVDEAPVHTGEFDFDTVYAFFSRGFMDESEGTLGVRIVYDGEVGETAARAGNVSISWSPNE
jgi:hypothetical protein